MDQQLPEMVEIPEGQFRMGDIWGDGEKDETPVYDVHIRSFLLGKYAVSNHQFLRFLNEEWVHQVNRAAEIIAFRNNCIQYENRAFSCSAKFLSLPVVNVSWEGARAYCDWLKKQTGKTFRLPLEEEWQYAGMGPNHSKWSHGDVFNSKEYVCARKKPEPIDWGNPTIWELFNMTGNIFEWCENPFSFSLAPDADTQVLSKDRIIKGGAFILSDSANFRNAKRFSCYQTSCLNCIGFRVACSV